MAAGSTIIDTTTTSLEMVKRVADMCAAKGVGYLDAPVSGRPPKMSMLIGGPESRSIADEIAAHRGAA